MFKKKFSIIFLCLGLSVFPLQAGWLDSIKFYLGLKSSPLASKELQEMGKKAQEDVGVEPSDIYYFGNVSIVKEEDHPSTTSEKEELSAEKVINVSPAHYNCFTHHIYCLRGMEKIPFGALNGCFHHEAVHKKYRYRDLWNLIWPGIGAFILQGSVGFYELTKGYSGYLTLASLPVTIFLYMKVTDFFRHKEEYKADTEGFLATGCELCVKEIAEFRPKRCSDSGKKYLQNGYLCKEEILEIAKKLKGRGCYHHAQSDQKND
ncbi:TPA: hypothetical protein DIC20_00830 [Candidatus Dependentiae bacterium]|nr:MAG: hypothetical protein US03_C0015G0009 [candidate division TM6 bacterium GW2011_GWF2_36_131]KKQ02828.1 MAG: hypothetical protein US13_C0009G0020 [candidate division TM6 bacterium GW2011_GWE2_36_25]KKQ18963.1 MAG: hypothetical protein US32_C0019G0006 [candidate division TM6 bacterium GW2011_GWA2_36_9]HBR71006.1 hypothetical protein [Candidatus Dependentiae bacterium]HCU00231.1 hypothetical protein [Candidatus Dependentiae bacterium]